MLGHRCCIDRVNRGRPRLCYVILLRCAVHVNNSVYYCVRMIYVIIGLLYAFMLWMYKNQRFYKLIIFDNNLFITTRSTADISACINSSNADPTDLWITAGLITEKLWSILSRFLHQMNELWMFYGILMRPLMARSQICDWPMHLSPSSRHIAAIAPSRFHLRLFVFLFL